MSNLKKWLAAALAAAFGAAMGYLCKRWGVCP